MKAQERALFIIVLADLVYCLYRVFRKEPEQCQSQQCKPTPK